MHQEYFPLSKGDLYFYLFIYLFILTSVNANQSKKESCLCFFPFGVSDGRCGLIVSIPDHCLPFYSTLKEMSLLLRSEFFHVSGQQLLTGETKVHKSELPPFEVFPFTLKAPYY